MGQDSNFRVFFKPLYIFDLPRRILQLVQASSLWDGNTRNSLPHSSGIARRTAESRAEQNPRWPGLSNEILSNWQDTTYSYLCFVAGIYIYIWFIVIVAYHFARSNPVVIPDLASFTKKKDVFASLSCLTRPSAWIKVIRTKVSAKEAFVQPATQPIFKSRRLNDSIIHLHVSGHFGKIVPYKFPDFFGRSRLGWSSLPLFAPQC